MTELKSAVEKLQEANPSYNMRHAIAKKAGVSYSTVINVLKGVSPTAPAAQKVRTVIQQELAATVREAVEGVTERTQQITQTAGKASLTRIQAVLDTWQAMHSEEQEIALMFFNRGTAPRDYKHTIS